MLLIAVTGPVGSGKSTLLSTLAAWWSARGKRLDGVIAEAAGDREPGRGSAAYVLHWPATGEREPFAQRDETRTPAYRFEDAAWERLSEWAASLASTPTAPLIFLDELGRLEAAGGGLMQLWPSITEADPEIVVVAVREDCAADIETRTGRFDIRVDPRAPDAWDRMRAACVEHADWSRVGLYGAGAGGVEVTIGSALHGARVPLRGLALSSTQAAVMTHAGEGLGRRARVVWVPFIAAGLKALSPAGSRVRPMLAITIQGILFAASSSMLGWNALGVGLGGALVGIWAAGQGVVLQYLLVGTDLLRAYEAVVDWVDARWDVGMPGIITAIAMWMVAWGVVAGSVTLAVWKRRALPQRLRTMMERGVVRVHLQRRPGGRLTAVGQAARDIARPVFWIPILLVVTILLLSGSPAERAFWIVMRAATIGFVLFSLVRMIDPARVVGWLRAHGHWGPAIAFARALNEHRPGAERHNR